MGDGSGTKNNSEKNDNDKEGNGFSALFHVVLSYLSF